MTSPSPLASYSEVPQTTCEGGGKNGWEKEEKSIGFHYPVVLCHWPVNDPVTVVVQGRHGPTLNRCWQEENMLTGTRNKLEHRFALQVAVQRGIVQGHHAARDRGEGLRMVGIGVGWGGRSPSQPSSTVWLSRSLAQMLLSLYKLFTSGYTKGNSAALIVAEGKFIQKIKHNSTAPANVCKSLSRTYVAAYAVCT